MKDWFRVFNIGAPSSETMGKSMRMTFLICTTSLLALSACAGLGHNREPQPESMQRAEEIGKLPIGRIVAVLQVDTDRGHPQLPASVAATRAISGPAGVLAADALNTLHNRDWFFRYTVRMQSGGLRQFDAIHTFTTCACVAVRAGLDPNSFAIVLAVPGLCDQTPEAWVEKTSNGGLR